MYIPRDIINIIKEYNVPLEGKVTQMRKWDEILYCPICVACRIYLYVGAPRIIYAPGVDKFEIYRSEFFGDFIISKYSFIIEEEVPQEYLKYLLQMDFIGMAEEVKYRSNIGYSFVYHGNFTMRKRLKLKWAIYKRHLSRLF